MTGLTIHWLIYYRRPGTPSRVASLTYGLEWGWSHLHRARGLRLYFHKWTWAGFWHDYRKIIE